VEVWRERMRTHGESAYVQLIVNERREAGASLPHTHAQLYALDFVPAAVARERERAAAYADRMMGQNLLEDLIAEEVRRGGRIVVLPRLTHLAGLELSSEISLNIVAPEHAASLLRDA